MMTHRSKLTVLFACIPIGAAWFFLLWGPQQEGLHKGKQNVSEASATKSSLQTQVDTLKSLKDDPALKESVEKFENAVPSVPDLDGFLRQLQKASDNSGVKITSMSPNQPAASAPVGDDPVIADAATIQVSISVSGTYDQTTRFMDQLASMDRLVVTDSANLVRSASDEQQLDTVFTVRMFTTAVPVTTVPAGVTATTAAAK